VLELPINCSHGAKYRRNPKCSSMNLLKNSIVNVCPDSHDRIGSTSSIRIWTEKDINLFDFHLDFISPVNMRSPNSAINLLAAIVKLICADRQLLRQWINSNEESLAACWNCAQCCCNCVVTSIPAKGFNYAWFIRLSPGVGLGECQGTLLDSLELIFPNVKLRSQLQASPALEVNLRRGCLGT